MIFNRVKSKIQVANYIKRILTYETTTDNRNIRPGDFHFFLNTILAAENNNNDDVNRKDVKTRECIVRKGVFPRKVPPNTTNGR